MSSSSSSVKIDWNQFPEVVRFFEGITNIESFDVDELFGRFFINHQDFIKVKVIDAAKNRETAFCSRFNRSEGSPCKNKECKFRHVCVLCKGKHGVLEQDKSKTLLCQRYKLLVDQLYILKTQLGDIKAVHTRFLEDTRERPQAISILRRSPTPAPWALTPTPSTPPLPPPTDDIVRIQCALDRGQSITASLRRLIVGGLPEGFTVSIHEDAVVSEGKTVISSHSSETLQRSLTVHIKY